MQVTFDVNFYKNPKGFGKEWSHKHSETWEKTDNFCPNCGHKQVWMESYGADYYVGEEYLCLSCDHRFHMPDGPNKADGDQDVQRLEHIRKIILCAT